LDRGRAPMSVKVFLSAVSDEFRPYREQLRSDLTRHNVEVKVQEDFKNLGGDTLDKLDVYIGHCDAVVHLVGDMTGFEPGEREQRALLAKYPDLVDQLPPLAKALRGGLGVSYTQWEAWLALYHGKLLLTAKAEEAAIRGPQYTPTPNSRAAQVQHLARLEAVRRYPGCAFASPADLAKHIAYTAILDLLVKDYAEVEARARAVAEGFIREMAKKVAGDRSLDFEGMKQAVRNAIEIYEKEVAGQTQTNIDALVDEALEKARALVDVGKSGVARATLRKAAEQMRREEEEHRERYVLGVKALYNRERDIALAAYDGEAAAEAIVVLAKAIHGADAALIVEFLNSEGTTLYEYGRDRGSNVHLLALIELRRKLLAATAPGIERGTAYQNLGVALWSLGQRESGTTRLDEAVAAYREALKERTRERTPLDWAATQLNLGAALSRLGERESGTARLDEAVAAYREALKEITRERVPVDWAGTQHNLGNVLFRLGQRESGTVRLNEAVAAYREALKEWTRELVPLQWAMTQNGIGNALVAFGERENTTERLNEAVVIYRDALKEWTRERFPLDWATTQTNLGNVLFRLGERESGTARLDEAVVAYHEALQERTRERVPLDWAATQNNLGGALRLLGERENGTARLNEAVAAYREALLESTRERVPLEWAMTQHNLGNALMTLGKRERGTERLDEAMAAYHEALQERTRERVPLDWATSLGNQGMAKTAIAERSNDLGMAVSALAQIETALQIMRNARQEPYGHFYEGRAAEARSLVARLREAR
jgi:tetratricopeptide (TPR) repeat protein